MLQRNAVSTYDFDAIWRTSSKMNVLRHGIAHIVQQKPRFGDRLEHSISECMALNIKFES